MYDSVVNLNVRHKEENPTDVYDQKIHSNCEYLRQTMAAHLFLTQQKENKHTLKFIQITRAH